MLCEKHQSSDNAQFDPFLRLGFFTNFYDYKLYKKLDFDSDSYSLPLASKNRKELEGFGLRPWPPSALSAQGSPLGVALGGACGRVLAHASDRHDATFDIAVRVSERTAVALPQGWVRGNPKGREGQGVVWKQLHLSGSNS